MTAGNEGPAMRPRRLLRSFMRDERGVSAVEFALAGGIFLIMCLMTFEFGIDLFTQALLDDATREAARQIRIGTITGSSSSNLSTFTGYVCNGVNSGPGASLLLPSCTANLQVWVKSGAQTAGFSGLATTASGGSLVGNGTFTALSGGQDVVVQVAYNKPFSFYRAIGLGSAFLMSTQIIQIEPYS